MCDVNPQMTAANDTKAHGKTEALILRDGLAPIYPAICAKDGRIVFQRRNENAGLPGLAAALGTTLDLGYWEYTPGTFTMRFWFLREQALPTGERIQQIQDIKSLGDAVKMLNLDIRALVVDPPK
jgi:hypothetical protein